MKKILLLALLIMAFCATPVLAGDAFYGTVLAETRLDDAPTSVTSDGIDVSQYDKVAFWVTYDETEDGGGVSGDITLQVSYDDTTYHAAKFYDYTGGSTLQTTENLAGDGSYIFWMDRDMSVKYARVICTGNATDANDLIDVTVNYSAQK